MKGDRARAIDTLQSALEASGKAFGQKLEYFLATGNLISRSNLDLQQNAGFTVVADRLNAARYLSHFRSIHRGHYFTEMKTTTVRKLLPESWGFLCPVHTPDGAPCGLLNHITMACFPLPADEPLSSSHYQLPSSPLSPESFTPNMWRSAINRLIASPLGGSASLHDTIPVMVDGELIA